jgi:hypothetical protein
MTKAKKILDLSIFSRVISSGTYSYELMQKLEAIQMAKLL